MATVDHDCPCETCIDWRVAQSEALGEHIATVLRLILQDLEIDPEDEHVAAVCARRLRQANPTD